MSTPTEDADILIEDDKTPAADDVVKVEAAPEPKKVITPDEGIEELKAQLAAQTQEAERERASRLQAETRARDAETRAVAASTEVRDSNVQLVQNAIETVKANTSILKARLAQARADGDTDVEGDVIVELGDAGAKLRELQTGLEQMKARPALRQADPVPSDPVEALARQLSPRSASWVRDHPEFARDQVKYQRMLAAHNLAMTEGVQAESDDYFKRVEDILGVRQADPVDNIETGAPQRRASPPAAPVSRSAPTNGGQKPRVVRLTADEREIAQMMGITEVEYAKNKLALQEEGKMS